jgi:hypothetical protein
MILRGMLKPFLRRALAPALFAALCGSGVAHAIIDGAIDHNTVQSSWAGVGSITIGTGTYSGTLVAPNYVLTAAHVVGNRRPEEITFNLNFGGDLTHRIVAEAVFVQPGYTGGAGLQGSGNRDLALIRLSEPAPAGVPIYSIFEGLLPQGSILTLVGYGGGGTGLTGPTEQPHPAVKRVGANVAECFAHTPGFESCNLPALTGPGPRALYFYDFDGPATPGKPSNGLANEAALAGGDSGSPAFVNVHGQWQLAGVNTFSGRVTEKGPIGMYGSVGGGVLLSDENGHWLRSVMAPHQDQTGTRSTLPEPRTWFLLGLGLLLVARSVHTEVVKRRR